MSNSPRAGLAVAGLSLGTSLNPLNSSMIAVALVVLREDFGLDVATVTWVITAFYLTSAAGQPLMGRLADRFGPRRLFLLGMALVAVTCALAPFAPNFALLCVARAFMALGTATAYPSAVVMVAALAREANVKSTRPLGRIQMANTSAAAVGPVVGGLLVSLVGWQALFLINVPLSLLAILVVRRFAPADGARERGRVSELVRDSDLPGIGAFIGALVLVMMAMLNVLPDYRWWLLGGGLVLAALFAWRELRFSPPFLDLRLLGRNRPLLLVYLGFALFNGVYYFAFFGLPQLLQTAGGYNPGVVGPADAAARRDLGGRDAVRGPRDRPVRRAAGADRRRRAAPGRVCGDVAADGLPRRPAGARADRPAGCAVLRGRHFLKPGHVRVHPAGGARGGRRDLPDLPLPRRDHGHRADRHLLRHAA